MAEDQRPGRAPAKRIAVLLTCLRLLTFLLP